MNPKVKTAIITSVITAFICFSVFFAVGPGWFKENVSTEGLDGVEEKLAEIRDVIDDSSIYTLDEEEAINKAYYGYLSGLNDKYSEYFSKEEYEEFISGTQGNFTGIGIRVYSGEDTLKDGLFIMRVLGNSPAELAGLKAADVIIKVNGNDIRGLKYDDVLDDLLGEEGTTVNITVERTAADNTKSEKTVDITREEFVQREVDYSLEDNIGYIQIYEFSEVALTEFRAALIDLNSKGAEGFIFDVRNNPGGNLDTVVGMIDLLVPEEDIIIIQYKDDEVVRRSTNARLTSAPMVVLINGESASASELFSSALRDINGSKLIGTKSYGKAVGQTTKQLYDGSAIKLTIFRYLTKSRTDFNGKGLEPDYVVNLDEQKQLNLYALEKNDDDQYIKALEVIKEQINNLGG